jgi:hypothetical protein
MDKGALAASAGYPQYLTSIGNQCLGSLRLANLITLRKYASSSCELPATKLKSWPEPGFDRGMHPALIDALQVRRRRLGEHACSITRARAGPHG